MTAVYVCGNQHAKIRDHAIKMRHKTLACNCTHLKSIAGMNQQHSGACPTPSVTEGGRRTLDAARGTGRRERVDSRCMQRESRRDTRDVSRARGWHGMRGDERACMRIACEMREVFSARYRYSSGRVIWGTWTREACVFAQRAASIAAESRCASLSSGLIMEHGEAVESLNMRHAALTASYT